MRHALPFLLLLASMQSQAWESRVSRFAPDFQGDHLEFVTGRSVELTANETSAKKSVTTTMFEKSANGLFDMTKGCYLHVPTEARTKPVISAGRRLRIVRDYFWNEILRRTDVSSNVNIVDADTQELVAMAFCKPSSFARSVDASMAFLGGQVMGAAPVRQVEAGSPEAAR